MISDVSNLNFFYIHMQVQFDSALSRRTAILGSAESRKNANIFANSQKIAKMFFRTKTEAGLD